MPEKSPKKTSVKNETTKTEKATYERKPQRLFRSETDRMLGGVAGGLGEYFAIDPTIFRLIFVFLFVFAGSGVLLYLVLWLIIPSERNLNSSSENTVRESSSEIREKAESMAKSFSGRQDSRFYWGLGLILFGLFFILRNLGILQFFAFDRFWPLLLIIIGLAILAKK